MEPLFLAVICGCNAGLFREVLHEVYIPRIQRGNASFAANVLGARGALLSVLVHFFEHGRWGSPVESGVEGQSLTAEDQLFILMQAGLYLTATRGLGSSGRTHLLRTGGALVSFPQSSSAFVCGTNGSVALFPQHRQADCTNADCEPNILTSPKRRMTLFC